MKEAVLVTGASSGIGLAIAELFARNGYFVYATSRSCKEERKELGTGVIVYKKMDVTSEESIRNAISSCNDIGIVIHSAGFGIAGPAEEVPIEQVQKQMDTNYYGVLRVNAAVLPSMRKRRQGLICIISSVGGRIGLPFQSHYSSSKFAIEAYAEALRLELNPYNIGVGLIEPGDTKTYFTKNRKTVCLENSEYKSACNKALARIEFDEQNGTSPEKVAAVALKLARKKRVPVRKAVGVGYKCILFLQRILPSRLFDWIVGKYYIG